MAAFTELAPFLRFVKDNLAMLCSACDKGYIQGAPSPYETCIQCGGTGQIPRPGAVELYDALMLVDDISGVVVPRSDAEQHVAAENWAHKQGYTITWDAKYDYGWWFWREAYGGHALEFFAGLQAALMASGWTDVKETGE